MGSLPPPKFVLSKANISKAQNCLYSCCGIALIWVLPDLSQNLKRFYSYLFSTTPEISASLDINKTSATSSVETGDVFEYIIQYSCAGITDNCEGVVITDPLPVGLEFVELIGSVHTTSEVYDPGTRTVTFTLIDPLSAGTSGQVQIRVRFPNGQTPNGFTVANTAYISGTNAPSDSSTFNVTAIAAAKPNVEKQFTSGGAAGSTTTYQFMFCNNPTDTLGTLNLEQISIIDTLPPGAVFIEAGGGGAGVSYLYDSTSHVVVITKDDLLVGDCTWPKVTIEYPEPTFSVGDSIENVGQFSFTPVGGTRDTISSTYSHVLTVPNTQARSLKTNSHGSLYPGQGGTYRIDVLINGTEALDSFCVNDTIPPGLDITQFDVGGWYYGGVSGPEYRVDVYYTTNLNGPTLVPGSPFSIWDPNDFISKSDLGLVEGEFITVINWCLGDAPLGFGTFEEIEIQYNVMDTASAGVVTNCGELTSTTPGATMNNGCVDFNISPLDPGIKLNPNKAYVPYVTFNQGDKFFFRLVIKNELGGADSIVDPVVYDLLPEGVKYETGTWFLPPWGNIPGYPLPDFSVVSDYKGTGRDFLRWEWTGASSIKIPPGERVIIEFEVEITDYALGGYPAFANEFFVETSTLTDCWGSREEPDILDFNDNGDLAELLCGGRAFVNVNEVISLESEKLVRGQLDSTWTKYPDIGYTVPGGISDYQLVVKNQGNVPLDSVIIIDILPHVGDNGVIVNNPRDSRWKPNLVGPVMAPPGVTVYYSTETNPCRSDEGIVPSGPVGCSAPNWSSVPPSNLTTVQSLKFEFGSIILNPQDSIILEWPMRAPVNALSTIGAPPDSIAWNSFAFIGQRSDNGDLLLPAEPLKVGISMDNEVPGVIGDFVWVDTNKDGIQDVGEPGYDGLRVELYKDNGDGLANPGLDTLVNFTVTANGGYYLFPNLPADDYFLVFYKPAPYAISPNNVGGDDAIDSDGVAVNYNGFLVAITPVTNILDTEYDFDWDLGIYPNDLGAIGNYVWADVDSNGVQDESLIYGINGVVVNLYQSGSSAVFYASDTTTNDFNGNPGYYLFDQLPPGDYFLEFVLPDSTQFTSPGATGSSDPLDSDPDLSTGRTEVFTVLANIFDDTWDAGLILVGIEVCGNGIDDDLDGEIDEGCLEICDNGIDDDGDGFIDCEDTDCIPLAQILNTGGCGQAGISFSAMDPDSSMTYAWDFGIHGTPDSAVGSGPHEVVFVNCDENEVILTVSTTYCSVSDTILYSGRDTISPVFDPVTVPADTVIDCTEMIPTPVVVVANDDCADSISVNYTEVIISHDAASWSTDPGCGILYEVTAGSYDDKGTPGTGDDEMSFLLTVIGRNVSAGWSTTITGNSFEGAYFTSQTIGPFLSNGSVVSFSITDDGSPACQVNVTVDASSF